MPLFKGYVDVAVQDVSCVTDNVLVRKENSILFARRSQPTHDQGSPADGGAHDQGGDDLNMLLKHHETFSYERQDVLEAGVARTTWQRTTTRVYGQNEHCHVLCHPSYGTVPVKSG